MNQLQTKIKNLYLESPLMTASGTSGHGNEIAVLDKHQGMIASLGAFVTKGVTLQPKEGNPELRIVEAHSGILNSIGLQNEGATFFAENELSRLNGFKLPVVVNISAETVEEFGLLASYLSHHDPDQIIAGIEINVSCPNVKAGGIQFGADPLQVEQVVRKVRENTDSRVLVITKLTPNVTDITVPARAAINGGTDALSMINTLRAMAIDIHTARPVLGNKTGGLSGPAIKPVGLFMVWDCFQKIPECHSKQIPIIGIGGISTWQDVIEYTMAGASAVGIGTAWFVNPDIFQEIHGGIKKYMAQAGQSVMGLIGKAHTE